MSAVPALPSAGGRLDELPRLVSTAKAEARVWGRLLSFDRKSQPGS